jgi:uncharacterized protein YegL
MSGNPIEAVKQGIAELHTNLMDDPSAIESAYLSVIAFSSEARQVVPLTELTHFVAPQLIAGGTTALGAAISLLTSCIEQEVRKGSSREQSDWKPIVFIMTDGVPTDDYRSAATRLKSMRCANIIGVAVGPDASPQALKDITEIVLAFKDMSPGAFKSFFEWVTQSVRQTSVAVQHGANVSATGVNLPPPPPMINIVP